MQRRDDAVGIYLSVPFCKAKCSFCNFASGVFPESRIEGYIQRLCAELRGARAAVDRLGGRLPERVDTIYFGGGTPSLLQANHFAQVFRVLHEEFSVDADAEVTLEAAPGQMDHVALEAAMRLGVNRVSFGVQSFVDAESAAVGRLHTGAKCREEIARMERMGVERLSLDLIAGLPHQTGDSWDFSVREAVETGVGHVSVYLLEVDEDSRLGREAIEGGVKYGAGALPSEDVAAEWYLAACEKLGAAGLAQYEISNFARVGQASRHNLKYWHRQPYLGVGLDAHSMLVCDGDGGDVAVRWANTDDMDGYMASGVPARGVQGLTVLGAGSPEVDRIGVDEAFEESFFLGLRLNEGVDLGWLRNEFGGVRMDQALGSLRDVEEAGLVERRDSRVRLTASGRLASNEVFSRLLVA
ncbi:hypothetical protein GRAN_2712 [Granulicella sibirica]|uniref:Heme chaperone HemW n=1 Tax=Granulicella sibirica TaxID=2479048 RepID=A0A4Q0SXH9_9BACT|nr:hypothetical protein GRAN_2712 [Granulicella sibirica]